MYMAEVSAVRTIDVSVDSTSEDLRELGAMDSAVVRFVADFVVQVELPSKARPAAERAASRSQARGNTGRPYSVGDVVLCLQPGQPLPGRPQVAAFLAEVDDARPAFPVIGRVQNVDELAALATELQARNEPGEILTAPVDVKIVLR